MCTLCLDRVNSDMFTPRKWFVTVSISMHSARSPRLCWCPHAGDADFPWMCVCVHCQLLASVAGCKVTVSSRLVTLTTIITADKQRLVTEHLHSPALLHYNLDQQHQDNMASVTPATSTAKDDAASDAPYVLAADEKEPASQV